MPFKTVRLKKGPGRGGAAHRPSRAAYAWAEKNGGVSMKKWLSRIMVLVMLLSLVAGQAWAAVIPPYYSEEVAEMVQRTKGDECWKTEAFNVQQLPRNFRTVNSALRTPKHGKAMPDLTGLRELRISGSGQFSVLQLDAVLDAIKKEGNGASTVYVVDLRQECHGFLNGIAVGWYTPNAWGNVYKPQAQILKEEKDLLRGQVGKMTRLYKYDKKKLVYSSSVSPVSASTEEEIVLEHGAHYLRYTNTDHVWPQPEQIDRFVEFYKNLPPHAWLHFHCHAGKGRTTSYMAIVDMLNNAPKVSLENIVARQHLLGGANLLSAKGTKKEPWRAVVNKDKVEKVHLFYRYVTEVPKLDIPWSQWLRQQLAQQAA